MSCQFFKKKKTITVAYNLNIQNIEERKDFISEIQSLHLYLPRGNSEEEENTCVRLTTEGYWEGLSTQRHVFSKTHEEAPLRQRMWLPGSWHGQHRFMEKKTHWPRICSISIRGTRWATLHKSFISPGFLPHLQKKVFKASLNVIILRGY